VRVVALSWISGLSRLGELEVVIIPRPGIIDLDILGTAMAYTSSLL
jgi:hypothetical protein